MDSSLGELFQKLLTKENKGSIHMALKRGHTGAEAASRPLNQHRCWIMYHHKTNCFFQKGSRAADTGWSP